MRFKGSIPSFRPLITLTERFYSMKNTSLCYIERGDEYLMLHRIEKEDDENAGKWVGVGGKFEEGESPEGCMLREVYEETGLKLHSWAFRGVITFSYDTWETEYMHLFTSDDFSGSLTDCDEGVLQWLPKSHILDMPIWEGDRIFLHLLETGRPFFSLKLSYGEDGNLIGAELDGKKIDCTEYMAG